MHLHNRVIIPDDILSQTVGDDTVLLNLKIENYFGLNEVGTRVWQLFCAQKTCHQVLEILLEEYDIEPALLPRDLCDLNQMRDVQGLIKARGARRGTPQSEG